MPDEPSIRVTVANVLLDVVVTDRKGNPFSRLTPADLLVNQDGKPRPVISARLVELPRRPIAAAVPTPASGTNRAPRTIAFVVDDPGLSLQSMHSVREGVRRFVEKQVQLRVVDPAIKGENGRATVFKTLTVAPR